MTMNLKKQKFLLMRYISKYFGKFEWQSPSSKFDEKVPTRMSIAGTVLSKIKVYKIDPWLKVKRQKMTSSRNKVFFLSQASKWKMSFKFTFFVDFIWKIAAWLKLLFSSSSSSFPDTKTSTLATWLFFPEAVTRMTIARIALCTFVF